MNDNNTSWLDRVPLDAISIAVMVASMFLDGAYLRRFAYVGAFGTICAYTLNCVADLAVNKLTREFVRQRMGNLGKWRGRLVFVLLLFAFASFYYTSVFSWREASLQMPDEPNWLLWSIATFAPTVLAGLGVAEALRAGRSVGAKSTNVVPAAAPKSADVPAVAPEPAPVAPVVPGLAPDERRERVVAAWRDNPLLTQAEVAEMVGATRSTIGNDYRTLAEAGVLRRNGHGVEVN